MSIVIGFARCCMTEMEERLIKFGYLVADTSDDGACCEDDSWQDMRCSWKVECVELPQAKFFDLSFVFLSGAMNLGSSGFGALGAFFSSMGGGSLSAII